MRRVMTGLAVLLAAGACSIFEDPTPEQIFFQMTGAPGDSVQAIYSSDFLAGRNELGGTRVQVFGNDTVVHQLPIDTVFFIAETPQWFVQVETFGSDTVAVSVRVDVDDRNLVTQQGGIFPAEPWRYVYQFNQFLGQVQEVIF